MDANDRPFDLEGAEEFIEKDLKNPDTRLFALVLQKFAQEIRRLREENSELNHELAKGPGGRGDMDVPGRAELTPGKRVRAHKEFTSELTGKQIAIRLTSHNREVLEKEKRDTGIVEDAALIRRMIDAYGEYKNVKWFLDLWEENKKDFEKAGIGSLSQFFMAFLGEARLKTRDKL